MGKRFGPIYITRLGVHPLPRPDGENLNGYVSALIQESNRRYAMKQTKEKYEKEAVA